MLKLGTRVLVTGGAGFIGSHVTRILTNRGCQVRVLDDFSTGKRERIEGLGRRLELLQADVRNPSAIDRAARGAEAIIHLAAMPVGTDAGRAQEVNVGGTLHLLEWARARDKRERPRIVLCSSGSVYGKQSAYVLHEELTPRPQHAAAVMALAVEHFGRVYRETWGVPATVLRLFRTFGADEDAERPDASVVARFLRAALDGTSPVIVGDGQQTRDLIYVENVAHALIAAATGTQSAEPLNIASGEAIAINFLWTQVLELTGKKRLAIEPTFVPAPPWDPRHARPQIQRACKVLVGWAPSVRLRDGLARTVEAERASRSADPNSWFAPRGVHTPTPPPLARRTTPTPPPVPLLDLDDVGVEEIVEDTEQELDRAWDPVPALPGLAR
jgi:UDP-glucose 4-epimerase